MGRIKLPMIHTDFFHRPVLLPQVISYLKVEKNKKYIDATLGGGGYTFEILKLGGIVLGIDTDKDAIRFVEEKVKSQKSKVKINKDLFIEEGNFANIKSVAGKYGFEAVSGIIFDLGVSSYQLDKSGRGFSFHKDEVLDMRMSKKTKLTAAGILKNFSEDRLYEIFSSFSEELNSRTIARVIFRARTLKHGVSRTKDLVGIIDEAIGKHDPRVLARIFQALRIAVNSEIEALKKGLDQAMDLLVSGGRLIVLSYHSLEDRTVKMFFKQKEDESRLKVITKMMNIPRSHSVRMRVAQKT